MVDPARLQFTTRPCWGRSRDRGVAMLYVILFMVVLFGMVALAVDVGRVRAGKAQLSTAADAAVFAGASVIPSANFDEAEDRAVAVAAANFCHNVPVVLQAAEDVEFGLYRLTTRTYTAEGGTESNGNTVGRPECNAIKVTARRIAARGNPIDLTFARIVNRQSFDLIASATAFVRGGPRGAGLVGLEWVRMNGNTYTDSYDTEPYDPLNRNSNGTVMSNGPITMVGTADIWGDARPGMDSYVDRTPNTNVHGWEAPLDEPLNFPAVTVPAGVTNSGALRLTGGSTQTLTPGTYWFTTIDLKGNSTLVIQPNVKVYVTGNIDLTGGTVTNSGPAVGFEIFKVGGGQVDLGGGSLLKAHIYAPQAPVRIHGTGGFGLHGWVIGRSLEIDGNSAIHYDETLDYLDLPNRTLLVK